MSLKKNKIAMSLIEPLLTMTVFMLLVCSIFALMELNIEFSKKKDDKIKEILFLEAVKNEIIYNCSREEILKYINEDLYMQDVNMNFKEVKESNNIIQLFSKETFNEYYLKINPIYNADDGTISIKYMMEGKELIRNGEWYKGRI